MRNFITLSATLIIMALANLCHAKTIAFKTDTIHQVSKDTTGYSGKYQRTIHGDLFYITFEVKDGTVFGNTLWDGRRFKLNHIAGDKFIVDGMDWGVVFIRDKNKQITQVLVMGTDYWVKLKQ